jgi:hypothetical protein
VENGTGVCGEAAWCIADKEQVSREAPISRTARQRVTDKLPGLRTGVLFRDLAGDGRVSLKAFAFDLDLKTRYPRFDSWLETHGRVNGTVC